MEDMAGSQEGAYMSTYEHEILEIRHRIDGCCCGDVLQGYIDPTHVITHMYYIHVYPGLSTARCLYP